MPILVLRIDKKRSNICTVKVNGYFIIQYVVHMTGTKLGKKHVIYQKLEKGDICLQTWKSVLWHVNVHFTGLKMQRGSHETKFWRSLNAKMKCIGGYSLKSRWENGVICLVIMFTSRVVVIKMSQMAHFLYHLLMTTKNQSQFGQNF